jgi:hypothetical protein
LSPNHTPNALFLIAANAFSASTSGTFLHKAKSLARARQGV